MEDREKKEFQDWYNMFISDYDKKPTLFEVWKESRKELKEKIGELEDDLYILEERVSKWS